MPILQDSLAERAQILKSLRTNLLRQREKFQSYLQLLENQECAILEGDTEKLEVHARLEQALVREICVLQRVILPLEELYRHAYPREEESTRRLQRSLEGLRERVLQRNMNNQKLLRSRLESLRREIQGLRKEQRNPSPYARIAVPSLVDISS